MVQEGEGAAEAIAGLSVVERWTTRTQSRDYPVLKQH
jgi:hypothetical protein